MSNWTHIHTVGEEPPQYDESSHFTILVTKNHVPFEEVDEMTGETVTGWDYDEIRIPKEDWEVYKKCLENTQDITDLQLALVEVYEQIGG